jgi:hypothetical protein
MKPADYPMGDYNANDEEHKMILSGGFFGNSQGTGTDRQEAKYQCPMNCEGNKTYNQPGVCPVCNMQLVMVGLDEPLIRIE